MTKRLTLAATLCALALTPTAALAGTTAYRVDANGTGSYKLDLDLSQNGSIETSTVDATFAWTSFVAAVQFDEAGRLVGIVEQPDQPTTLTGQLKRKIDLVSPSAPDRAIHTTCQGADVTDAPMTTTSMQRVSDHVISFTPFERVSFADHQCSDGSKYAFGIFEDEGDPHGLWQPEGFSSDFEQRFELPAEAIGSGRIVQWVKPGAGQVIPQACPGYSQGPGEKCTVTMAWEGSITFTKISGNPLEPAPLVTPPTPPTRVDGPPVVDDLLTPLVPLKAKVAPGAKSVSFTATCPAGCAGKATIAAAKLKFRVAAGGPRTVKLAIPKAARRKLRGAKRATLAVALTPPNGAPKRTTLRIALPRR